VTSAGRDRGSQEAGPIVVVVTRAVARRRRRNAAAMRAVYEAALRTRGLSQTIPGAPS
jgi:hypothetical protein